MQKVKHFFKNNLTIVLSGIIVLCLVLFLFAINSSWPFGNKSCAMYDLSAQIVQQINLVRDIFEGKGTLFYSHRLGGGMSIFATLIYFVFSPFYIVLLIGGRSNTILTVNLVLLIYLMAVAISMAFCLKNLFPLVSNFFQIVLSLCYTFGAFILLNYSFIIWLNFMILLPIIFVAFKRMITEKKYLLFSFLTFVFIISCYALGSTSQFLLLAIYYLYILICVDKYHRREHLVRLTVAMFIAIMLSSIILVPCYLESTATVRTGYQFNKFLDKNLATETNVRYVYYIIDFAISVLGILFIAFSNKKDKTNRFLSIVMAGLVIFSLIDISIMIVNFGLYASYSSRMCYIYSCLSIFACAKLLTDYKLKSVTETESLKQLNQQLTETNVNKKTKKLNFIMPIIWAVSLICLVAVVCNYFTSIKYIFYKFVINKVENLTIKLYFVIAICFVLQFIIAIILFKLKKISLKMIKISLSVMLIGQVIVNSSFVYFSAYNQDVYTSNAQIMKNVDDYDMVRQNIVNANLSYDTSSFAVFTSMLPEKNAKVMNNLGIENKMNSINITGGTLFSHSFLGLDYILFKGARNYPIFEYVDNIEFTDIDETNRNLHLYKYKYSTNGAFLATEIFNYDNTKTIFENQNAMAKSLGAENDIFDTFTLADLIENGYESLLVNKGRLLKQDNGCYKAGSSGCFISVEYDRGHEEIIYYTIPDEYFKNGIIKREQSYSEDYTYCFDYYEPYGFSMFLVPNQVVDFSDIKFGAINFEKYETEFEKIKSNMVDITYTKDGFKATVNVSNEDKYLVIPSINCNGFKALVNGESREIKDYASGFISIKLQAGENKIEIDYSYPYLLPSALICLVCIALAVVVIILYNKTKFKFLEKIIGKLYLIYIVCFVAIVYGGGIILTIIKNSL